MIKDITLNRVTIYPFKNPRIALARTETIRAQRKGIPKMARTAAQTPLKEAIVPTERSNSSTHIIRVDPKAMTAKIAICLEIFQKLVFEKNVAGLRVPNTIIIANNANIVP
jgi:hypothetical protein